MAFYLDNGRAPIGIATARTVSKSGEATHPFEFCALSRARIVISMMATSKHLIKQQDEVFNVSCRRSPYITQGIPRERLISPPFPEIPCNH